MVCYASPVRVVILVLASVAVAAAGCGYWIFGQHSYPSPCPRSIAKCINGRLVGSCVERVLPEDKKPQIVICPDNFCLNTTDVEICERFHGGRGRLHIPKWQNLDPGWE
jgi:hypothetical protein